ncbi:hypothetical protein [Desulfobulbus oralis]|nr:hypothetical protein [Desulfobulbus oralis]
MKETSQQREFSLAESGYDEARHLVSQRNALCERAEFFWDALTAR